MAQKAGDTANASLQQAKQHMQSQQESLRGNTGSATVMMTNEQEREEAKTINEMRDSVLGKLLLLARIF